MTTGPEQPFTSQSRIKGFQPGPIYWSASAAYPAALLDAVGGVPVQFLPNRRIAQRFNERVTVYVAITSFGVLLRSAENSVGFNEVHWLSPGDDLGGAEAIRFEGTMTSIVRGTVDHPVPLRIGLAMTCFAHIGQRGDEFAGMTTHMWFQPTQQEPSVRRTTYVKNLADMPLPS